MLKILLITLLVSQGVHAQRRLNADSFRAHVKPILNAILGDYYQMITLFPDFPKEIIPVIKELDTLTPDKEILVENCPRLITDKCSEQVRSLRNKLQSIRAMSLELLGRTNMSAALYLNSITGMKFMYQFDSQLEEVKGDLDNASFLLSAKISDKRETYTILKKLDVLDTLISLALVEYTPYSYRVDFRNFYYNFVHPVQQQISKNINYEFLNRNVDTLNFAINLLHLNLTKRNKKTPEGMAPYLQTIHNRWNSILRYYF